MSNFKLLPPLEIVRHMLHFDADAGILFWKNPDPQSARKPGQPWGSRQEVLYDSSNGTKLYIQGRFCRKYYYAHRLIWLYVTGCDPLQDMVDHINGNGLDNHFDNLRLATRSRNLVNQPGHARRKSKYKNVTYVKAKKSWKGEVRRNGVLYSTFQSRDEDAVYAAVLDLIQRLDNP
jgi:hypothetical protein